MSELPTRNAQTLVEAADPFGKEATALLKAMRQEALQRYGDLISPSAPAPTNDPLTPRSAFLIARLCSGGAAIACAALRPIDEEVAEVRRMYVAPEFRRQGIARRLLSELERLAREFGYKIIRVETGRRQPEAIALYEAWGFRRIAPYGRHIADPLSICFEKEVVGSAGHVTDGR